MKVLPDIQSDNVSNLFLYGAIMFANIDYIGIVDYVVKAILGGAVWFGFKLLQDHYSVRVKENARQNLKKEEEEKQKDETNERNK